MSAADGSWACSAKTPVGAQDFTLTVRVEGDRFSGEVSGALGSKRIADGRVEGDDLRWEMEVSSPMKVRLDCEASVEGDRIDGVVKAGWYGTYPLTGVRKA
ncbi:hypothetical protein [Sphingomonas sp. ID0503]|uniref:hypothetical protein n=1 Tax=Sphingomonas sp. ID0503 TaxID=3399691 RepID=UPI003AFB42CD